MAVRDVTSSEHDILDAIACGLIVRDATGTIEYANEAALAIFGGGPLSGRRFAQGIRRYRPDGTEIQPDDVPSFRAAREKHAVHEELIRIVRPDASERWALVAAVPVLDSAGQVVRTVTTFLDVTDRRRAEEALAASEQRVRAVVDSAIDGVVMIDADGCVREWNPQAEAIFGWTKAEALGRALTELIIPERYASAHREGLRRYLETGYGPVIGRRVELEARRRNDTEFPVELAVLPLVYGSTPVFAAFVRDISERRKAERRLATVHAVTDVLARASRAQEMRAEVLRVLGEGLGWEAAGFWRVEPSGIYLRELWIRDGVSLPGWREANEQLVFASGIGLPGQVWATGMSAWIVDMTKDPSMPRSAAAAAAGLRTALCFPILAGERGNAVIEFFSRDERAPEPEVLLVLEGVGSQIGQFLERRRAQLDRIETEARFQLLAENSSDVIVRRSPEGTFTYVSPAAKAILGYEPEEMIGRPAADFVHPLDRERKRAEFEGSEVSGTHVDTFRSLRKDGSFVWLESVSRQIRDASGAITEVQAAARDITQRKEAEEALEHQALHDLLTGLPNRALLQDRIEQALLALKRSLGIVGLLLVDLDRFKEVNDTYGHAVGDDLLREVARRFRDAVREGDTVARLGGDEFAVVLPDAADAAYAQQVAKRLRQALVAPFAVGAVPLWVEASIGIALAPEHGETADELLRHADVAMYDAKRGRTEVAIYRPDADRHTERALTLAGDLRGAIARDELVLHIQPIIDMRTKSCVAVESLVRWRHPERGLLEPSDFIPIAEETGFIKGLGLWVLNEAVRWRSTWRESRRAPVVAVNLSARNLRAGELPDLVASTLSMWSVPPSGLILEVTETAVMADAERSFEIVRRLAEMGVTIAIDDFGVGYSSLLQLQRMRAHHLKIDRTFVQNLRRDPNSQAIVGSTVLLAHSLGMKAVAEGVEDKETWERLAVLGCDLAQGYFVAAPMAAPDLMRWFAESPWAAIE